MSAAINPRVFIDIHGTPANWTAPEFDEWLDNCDAIRHDDQETDRFLAERMATQLGGAA